jgi:hypothetical protein
LIACERIENITRRGGIQLTEVGRASLSAEPVGVARIRPWRAVSRTEPRVLVFENVGCNSRPDASFSVAELADRKVRAATE